MLNLQGAASAEAPTTGLLVSNGCASRWHPVRGPSRGLLAFVLLGVLSAGGVVKAQAEQSARPAGGHHARSMALFLTGAAAALGAHEGGHLLFDAIFDARPGIDKVDFHGIPFFAITHRGDLSPRRELTISSAGFWVQHAGSEWLLTRRPRLRSEHAPLAKGILAFNVLASAGYAGAAFARTGPVQRDTRGIADSARLAEPWVGAIILAPAALDAWRYFHPEAKWAVWASRAAKAGMVLLVLR